MQLGEVSTGDASPLPDKSNDDDDTSTIDNDDCCNDVVAMPNKNIDAVVGQFKSVFLYLSCCLSQKIKTKSNQLSKKQKKTTKRNSKNQ